jgi:sporadic carbohydrate cluster 2OG-Fe(II) oxygenase
MSYADDGYEIVDLSLGARSIVGAGIAQLHQLLGPLEDYSGSDVELHALAQQWVSDIPRRVIECELAYFRKLIGCDLHIQSKPFLRISRPGVREDNIGLHRDTWYGDTPYELSIWIPFTDTDEGNALRVAPGSHIWSEETHPVERFDGEVEKGSTKHSLGFIYGQPKRLATPVSTVAVRIRVGQLIVFSLSLLHGQEVNCSTRTRVSMDVRLANSLAPIRWQRSRDEHYYQRLCSSPVTDAALRYEEAQK